MEFLKCTDVRWKGPEKRNKANVVATTATHPDSGSREFKKPRRRRRGQRRLKLNLHFTYESRDIRKSFSLFLTVQTISKLNMERSVKFGI